MFWNKLLLLFLLTACVQEPSSLMNDRPMIVVRDSHGVAAMADPACGSYPDTRIEGYKLGCAIDTHLARQIVNPEDLLGRAALDNQSVDAQRQTEIVNTYRTGKPNKPLGGLAASDIAERE